MKSSIQKLFAAHYIYFFATHLCTFIFFSFILDEIYSQENNDKKYPGIDIKEFR
jgi:hypothetical protein